MVFKESLKPSVATKERLSVVNWQSMAVKTGRVSSEAVAKAIWGIDWVKREISTSKTVSGSIRGNKGKSEAGTVVKMDSALGETIFNRLFSLTSKSILPTGR